MSRRSRVDLVPEPVSRVLAVHGPVRFLTRSGRAWDSQRLALAPLGDLLLLFTSRGSNTVRNLLVSPRAELVAGDDASGWQVRMQGRAVHAGRSTSHPRRSELVHWLPEGVPAPSLDVVEFVPEHVEFVDHREGEKHRWAGPTPAGTVPPEPVRWLRAAFEGSWPAAVVAVVACWTWVGWYGQDYTLRGLALALAILAALALQAGPRLAVRAASLRGWQQGRHRRQDAGVLADGWVGAVPAQVVGLVLVLVGVVLLGVVRVCWGDHLLLATLAASQLWYLLPLWLLHLSQRRPEPEDLPAREGPR